MSTDDDKRSYVKLYTASKWSGAKDPSFLEKWVPEFEAGADAHYMKDDDFSIWDTAVGNDCPPDGAGNPVVPGANSVGGKKLKKRSNTLYAVVYQSVDDPHLQTLIQDECNAAITAGTLSPLRKGYMAWEVLKRECSIVNSTMASDKTTFLRCREYIMNHGPRESRNTSDQE